MLRTVSKVTQLTQLDRIEGVVSKIRRRSYRGFFTKQTIGPLLTELRRAVENSSLPPEALALYRKMRKKIELLLRTSPIVIDDFKYELYGKREYYTDILIRNPKSIVEYVVLRRREVLEISLESDLTAIETQIDIEDTNVVL